MSLDKVPSVPSTIGRTYGHIPSPPDFRDIHFSHTHEKVTNVPPALNWLQFMGPVNDQKSEGCCTGEAAHYMRQFLTAKWVRPQIFVPLSPQFIYQNAVILDGGDPRTDPGATVRSAVQSLQKYGACPEVDEPFNPTTPGVLPTMTDYQDGLQYVAGVYKGLYSLHDIRQCIASGFVFNMGFEVMESFESDAMAATGLMSMPLATENVMGGHAVCAFGYDDNFVFPGTTLKGALLIRNSWGAGWGNNGNFYMPYAYLSSGRVSEAWMIHLSIWT
jgi:hypothetical protein